MTFLTYCRTALVLPVAALLMLALSPPGSSQPQRAASLKVSPGVYVAGQAITFEGNIGRTGVRQIHLELNFNRAGDGWERVEGFSTRTQSNGNFRFVHPAPAMGGILYRVAAGRYATPQVTFDAKSQDVVLAVRNGDRGGRGTAVAGRPFTIDVDTTPTLARRPDLPPPAIEGRTLTLQQRVRGDRWRTLDTSKTDARGQGSFTVTVQDTGMVVYRVREENWFAGSDQIGWFPSFPYYVNVTNTARAPRVRAPVAPVSRSTDRSTPSRSGASSTASQRFGWAPAVWDYAWEFGESLTSAPYRGTDKNGRWLDTSNGTGRVSKINGGLGIDSQRVNDAGPGDRGTTRVTLQRNGIKYGRWEVRMRVKSLENNARDYKARIELVPDLASDYHCGAQNITVAEVTAHGSTARFGVKARAKSREWTYSKRVGNIDDRPIAFAVEVTKSHITWFMEGDVVATVKSRAAVSDVPLALRLSLEGDGQREMNRTQFISDWNRGFTLERGRQVASGRALKLGKHGGGC